MRPRLACRVTTNARHGMTEALDYVTEQFGAGARHRALDRIERAIAHLAAYPASGHCRSDLTQNPHVRFWQVSPLLIAYREADGQLEILFVERTERDWHALLRDT
ncbi:MAG: type II toxin-antitoxin system RelE/ParE family toxin [Planctomycetota bacterium]